MYVLLGFVKPRINLEVLLPKHCQETFYVKVEIHPRKQIILFAPKYFRMHIGAFKCNCMCGVSTFSKF